MLTNSTELVTFTLPSGSSETKDDDWILIDGKNKILLLVVANSLIEHIIVV